jgi:hypothetical protein
MDYPPYVNAYGKIKSLFDGIKKAAVPQKFTQDFLSTMLGFQSSSDRALLSLLKRLGFLDEANNPTQAYKDYRDESRSKTVMAIQVKKAYSDLFSANEYANKLDKGKVIEILKRVTGVGEDDQRLDYAAATFLGLVFLSDFEAKDLEIPKKVIIEEKKILSNPPQQPIQQYPRREPMELPKPHQFGFSYTINLNLPETTDIEVFNAIFKSLKENILNEK